MPNDPIKEIREEFSYYQAAWNDIQTEGRKDMRYVAGDPWEANEKQARKDAERPALTSDELSQYINALVNEPRQNPRAIKISPEGNGATDKTAQLTEDLIRKIQYDSRAQSACTTGFQGAVERSYGYWRVGARYKADQVHEDDETKAGAFDQELYIGRIPNPDTVLGDPDGKEMDGSDWMGCFVTDKMRIKDFKRRYPKADVTDFTADQLRSASIDAPEWLDDHDIVVAEYFKVNIDSRKLFLVEQKKGEPIALFEDELPEGFDKSRIQRERKLEKRTVTQQITNGVEILDTIEIPIPWIPIIPCFGKEIYVNEGGRTVRKLLSLIRLARDPFMMYCYLVTQEAEEAGMSPKAPFVGYIGQFETDKAAWEMLNKVPRAYVQIDPLPDGQGGIGPIPVRPQFVPNFQAYEMAIQGARTRIQAAMGINALPTAAQRQNEKSGIALQRIESQEDRGSFHFIDNYNHALEHTGRILVAWKKFIYDNARDESIRKGNETYKRIRINDPNFTEKDENGNEVKVHYDAVTGDHGVTISTGPDTASQHDEANDLVQQIVTNIQAIAPLLPPGAAAKMLGIAIKMKNIGPLGDELADVVSPSADEAAKQQQIAQGQLQLQQSQQVIQELQAELQKLQLEKAGKVIQGEYHKQLQQMENDIKVLVALIQAKNEQTEQEAEMFKQFWIENHGAAHETAMQATQHAHEKDQAQAAAETALATQANATPSAENTGGGQ